MVNLKELKAKALALVAERKALSEKHIAAVEAKDAAAAEAAKALIAAKDAEIEALKAQVTEAEAHAASIKALDDFETRVRSLAEPAANRTIPAEPKNTRVIEQKQFEFALDYICGKSLDGEAWALMEPSWVPSKMKCGKAIRLPETMSAAILGPNYARMTGKTMYSVADATYNPSQAQSLFDREFQANLLMLPLPVPALMDSVNMVPSTTGSVLWPILNQTIGGETVQDFGGMAFEWRSETLAGRSGKPETEPTFDQLPIQCHELCGYMEVSDALLDRSAINIEALLTELSRGNLRYTVDRAILNGTGSGQPAGIVGDPGINLVARAAAGAVGWADLCNLENAIRPHHRAAAQYAMYYGVKNALKLETDTFGRPLFAASTANGVYDRLASWPYVETMNLPTLGHRGDIIFGNPRNYILVVERDVTFGRSEDYRFRQNLTAFRAYTRVGGAVALPRGFAVLDGPTES